MLMRHAAKEIENIKKFATSKQKERLVFRTLNPLDTRRCIYGQMTNGNCEKPLSLALINKCCTRTVDVDQGDFLKEDRDYWGKASALESFIIAHSKNNKHILQYIKGEVSTLKLTVTR